jgi:hypothetical protein
MSYSVVVSYQHFGKMCFLHLQDKRLNSAGKQLHVYGDRESKYRAVGGKGGGRGPYNGWC